MSKFAIRWLKNSSVSSLRGAPNANVRIQDGVKLRFLCDVCERVIEAFETPFAKHAFHPLHAETPPVRIAYGDWALKFAVSISWRVLKMHSEEDRFLNLPRSVRDASASALRTWRAFLLGKSEHPSEFEQHLIPFDLVEHPVRGMSEFFDRYIIRSVDEDLATADETLLVYSKLGKIVLFGVVPAPRPLKGWGNTKLHVRRGVIETNTAVRLPPGIMEYINSKAEDARIFWDGLSESQQLKLSAARQQRAGAEPAAEVFRAFAYDQKIAELNAEHRSRRRDV